MISTAGTLATFLIHVPNLSSELTWIQLTWFWGQHKFLGIAHVGPVDEGHLSLCFSQYPSSPQKSPFQLGGMSFQPPMVWKTVITLAPLAPNLKLPLYRKAKTYHFQRAGPTEQHWPLVTKVWSIESLGGGDLAVIPPVTVSLSGEQGYSMVEPQWTVSSSVSSQENSTPYGHLRHFPPIMFAESPPFGKRTDLSLCLLSAVWVWASFPTFSSVVKLVLLTLQVVMGMCETEDKEYGNICSIRW